MKYQYYKHLRALNPLTPAWRILDYINALITTGNIKKAIKLIKP